MDLKKILPENGPPINEVNKYIEKGIFFNEIWCLSACSPLVIVKDLIQASSLLKKNGKN